MVFKKKKKTVISVYNILRPLLPSSKTYIVHHQCMTTVSYVVVSCIWCVCTRIVHYVFKHKIVYTAHIIWAASATKKVKMTNLMRTPLQLVALYFNALGRNNWRLKITRKEKYKRSRWKKAGKWKMRRPFTFVYSFFPIHHILKK